MLQKSNLEDIAMFLGSKKENVPFLTFLQVLLEESVLA